MFVIVRLEATSIKCFKCTTIMILTEKDVGGCVKITWNAKWHIGVPRSGLKGRSCHVRSGTCRLLFNVRCNIVVHGSEKLAKQLK